MEMDGEKYYTEQAERNRGNSLHTVCTILACEENRHARILRKKSGNLPYELTEMDISPLAKNLFKNLGDFRSQIKAIPSQLDFYEMALEKEKQSIDLYAGFLQKASTDDEAQLFEYLVRQEKQHYSLFEELTELVRRPEEWVENAEFGIRKDY